MAEGNIFTQFGGEQYAAFSGSGGYRVSILGMTEALVPNLRRFDHPPTILEVGGGQGKSADALKEALRLNNIVPNIVVTEVDSRLLMHTKTTYQRVVNAAEALPFGVNIFDAIVGSQMVHWIEPESVPTFFSAAQRVLRSDGMFVLATSGIVDLGKINAHHFTRHPFVSENFLPALEKLLIEKKYWNPDDGTFQPRNPKVNPRYDNFTLQAYSNLLREKGFRNISTPIYMFPCSTGELTTRLTNLASLQMHFFKGDFAERISDDEIVELAEKAFTQAKEGAPELFEFFDEQPLEITLGAKEGTFGEPIPIISATK